jgi:HEPN domain-containing protein
MNSNERIFKREYAAELLQIAENDLVAAAALAPIKGVRKETVLFHVEQSVEKALKSVLCYLGKPVPFTHDLYAIIQRFDESNMPPGGFALHDLTPFATIRRYEEGNYLIEENDISIAIDSGELVLAWARKELGL